jgi:hypothetical protein
MRIYEGEISFLWDNGKHDVGQAEPETFNAWINQFFEEIVNVDTSVWDLHQRWQVVNEVLDAGLLVINGDVLELAQVAEPEPKPELQKVEG